MRGSEGIDPGIVDENVDMAISQFDSLLCHFARAGCAVQIGRDEIGFTPSGTNLTLMNWLPTR
jgi:hypothetical protein